MSQRIIFKTQRRVLVLMAGLAAGLHAASLPATGTDPSVHEIYEAAHAGQFDKAQTMMDQVLRQHPNSSKAHYVQAELYATQAKQDLARAELKKAEALDPGLTKERPRSVEELKAKLGLRSPAGATDAPMTTSRIPLARRGGTLIAPVLVNDTIKLDFTVDSGASDVSIPADVFSTLVRAGTISRSDMRPSRHYVTATGDTHEAQTFVIKSLKLGDIQVDNVVASVAPQRGPLLLGQSFLTRFKNWSIDNSTRELVLQR